MDTRTYGAGGAFLLDSPDPRRVFVPEMLTAEDALIGKTASDFLRQDVLPRVEAIEAGDHALHLGVSDEPEAGHDGAKALGSQAHLGGRLLTAHQQALRAVTRQRGEHLEEQR